MSTEPSAQEWILISSSPLLTGTVTEWATRADCGAVVTFCGTARNHSADHDVVEALEYETDVELAERRIGEIIDATRTRWPDLGAIAVHHRVGHVALTETATVVAVSAPHRDEAFDAARFCIDTLKKSVPMWKRELWHGGATWSSDTQSISKVPES
jgi:molybdopterin synthase catalytic subunit